MVYSEGDERREEQEGGTGEGVEKRGVWEKSISLPLQTCLCLRKRQSALSDQHSSLSCSPMLLVLSIASKISVAICFSVSLLPHLCNLSKSLTPFLDLSVSLSAISALLVLLCLPQAILLLFCPCFFFLLPLAHVTGPQPSVSGGEQNLVEWKRTHSFL